MHKYIKKRRSKCGNTGNGRPQIYALFKEILQRLA